MKDITEEPSKWDDMRQKKRILLLILSALMVVIVIYLTAYSPKAIIARELDRITESGEKSGISLADMEIIDYCKKQSTMYAKLEIPPEKYEQVKEKAFRFALNSDKWGEFSHMKKLMEGRGGITMNLDDYEERSIVVVLYGKMTSPQFWTTGENYYALVKENSGICYLYIVGE